ncbi:MAG: SAM-dependent chlorinase/fluorinase [Dehalococcoidia bacterium]|nr:SAM-dependent chlorinase/fluorinase [Dehalococcoidia bacterium]
MAGIITLTTDFGLSDAYVAAMKGVILGINPGVTLVDMGHPALREHLASVVTLMKASTSWRRFYAMLNRALPRWDTALPMPIDLDDEGTDK